MEVNTFEIKGENFLEHLLQTTFPFIYLYLLHRKNILSITQRRKTVYYKKESFVSLTILFRKFRNIQNIKLNIKFFFHPLIISTFSFLNFE